MFGMFVWSAGEKNSEMWVENTIPLGKCLGLEIFSWSCLQFTKWCLSTVSSSSERSFNRALENELEYRKFGLHTKVLDLRQFLR